MPVQAEQGTAQESRGALFDARHRAEPAVTLPSTKLAPPRLPTALVGRERLLADLDAAFSTPVTLLSASAGWGKTTLLSAWARRHPGQIAWLALDALDDELARFWIAVIAALRTRVPGIGTVALAMLRSPRPPSITAIVTDLLNELAGGETQDAPILLLLDDYQIIGERAIHESLQFAVEHLPAQMHLLISSRVDPDLPLARLRVRGQLTELRAADLRFTPEDIDLFLRQTLGFPLAEERCRYWSGAPRDGLPGCKWRHCRCVNRKTARPGSRPSQAAIAICWTTCRTKFSPRNRSPSSAFFCRSPSSGA